MAEKSEDSKQQSVMARLSNLYGIPLWAYVCGAVIVILAAMTKSLPVDMSGSILLLFAVGFIFGKIGDELPIWKDYFGGGALMAFLGASLLVGQHLIPAANIKGVQSLFDKGAGMLDFFIAIIITSSILSIDRKLLVKAVGGFIPMVIVGTATAFVMAILGGLLVGVSYQDCLLNYALPIMGGGNGAGAIPMSQIWGQVTGKDPKIWYSSAVAVLTIANIFAIIVGAMLNGIGNKFPKFSGQGELIKGNEEKEESVTVADKGKAAAITMEDGVFGLFVALSFYVLGNLIGKGLLPKIGGIAIHPYAWMVVLLIAANALEIVPAHAKAGVKKVNTFMMGKLMYVFLAGVGITFVEFEGLIEACNIVTVTISFFTVLGAVGGCWLFAGLVGFYPIESAIAAGLCHVNRGGSGDIEVLGASKRLNLMPYAQLATRLGGGMILIFGSILFNMWAK
ncbi:MAG: 2-hydroxycarboxylate transporter family protein [Sporomusaceae bacterium]|nr:2-hydroxycarboxylate transporter family protein [Sporomusaceae bacterium]